MGKDKNHEKKSKKHKHKHKKRKSKHKKHAKESIKTDNRPEAANDESGFEIPLELMNTKSHTPITPEEYQQRQKQLRRVIDPSTGRMRLIRGDGEVIEEIVTKGQHAKINSLATQTDGEMFQKNTVGALKRGN